MEKLKITWINNRDYSKNDPAVVAKINEIIEHLTGEGPNLLICPHCGSDQWHSDQWHSGCIATLMGGSVNIYTYSCTVCGESTRLRRVDQSKELSRGRQVVLGPEDEIQ